jgi:hypothetical protein
VLNEQAVNVDDALISRPGGVIRATDINQIRYEQAPFVFPQAIQGLEYMDTLRQDRTGVNYSFSGIDNKDLNNVQPGTVNQVSSIAAERVVQIARILAFAIEDLFAIVHEQVLKMGHKRETVQLAGKWVEVDPGAWKKRNRFKICVAFSAGNRDAQMARLNNVLAQQAQSMELKLPVCTAENYYNTLVELTKAADFMSPDRFWTDPAKMAPPPPPPPPPEIIKTHLEIVSREKIKAAEIMQAEVESRRRAEGEKYAVDAKAGADIIHTQLEHDYKHTAQTLESSHDAILAALFSNLDKAGDVASKAGGAVDKANEAIQSSHDGITKVHEKLNGVLDQVKQQTAISTGRKVLRKNPKGEVEGVDIVAPDGKVLQSHNVVKDSSGRVTGLQ